MMHDIMEVEKRLTLLPVGESVTISQFSNEYAEYEAFLKDDAAIAA